MKPVMRVNPWWFAIALPLWACIVFLFSPLAHSDPAPIPVVSSGGTVDADGLDNVFSTTGLLRRTGSATYDTITDSHSNWDAGYTYRLISASGSGPLTLTLNANALTGSIAQADTSTSGYLSSTDWNTFNNKSPVIPTSETVADATSITPNGNYRIVYQLNTQGAGTLTINAPSNVLSDGQSIMIKIKSSNVQTLSWNSVYLGGALGLPASTTGSSKIDKFVFQYDSVNSKYEFTGAAYAF